MNISNLGRLIGAGLLALGLHALAPGVAAGDPDRLTLGVADQIDATPAAAPSTVSAQRTPAARTDPLSPASGTRPTKNPE